MIRSRTWTWSSSKLRLFLHLLKQLLLMNLVSVEETGSTSVTLWTRWSNWTGLIILQRLLGSDNVPFASLHLDGRWEGYGSCSRWRCISSRVATLWLVQLNSTQFAWNLIHQETVVLLLEASASMWVTWLGNIILVRQLLGVKTNVGIALAILVNLMGSTSLGCRWSCLRKDVTSSHLRLGTWWLSTAWPSTYSIRIILVAILTNIKHSLWLLINQLAVLRVVFIISLDVNILIVVDWRNVTRRSLWTNSLVIVNFILIL